MRAEEISRSDPFQSASRNQGVEGAEPEEAAFLNAFKAAAPVRATPADYAGNDFPLARSITLTDAQALSDWVGATDPLDYYVFRTNEAVDFGLVLGGLSSDLDVALLDSNKNLLVWSTSTGTAVEKIRRQIAAGTYYIKVFQGNASASSGYSMQVGFRSPPKLVTPLPDKAFPEGKTTIYTLPASSFKDPDGNAITYSATLSNGASLPGWLSFNPSTLTFTGKPPDGTSDITVLVKATDENGQASDDFVISTPKENQSPYVNNPPPNVSATEKSFWTYRVPEDVFKDPDGDTLTYSVKMTNGSSWPGWLAFNASTRTFSGTVPEGTGMIGIDLTATDPKGGAALHRLQIDTPAAVAEDDFGSTAATAGALTFGTPVNGKIEKTGDTDWLAVTLTGGQKYTISMEGRPLADSRVRLSDAGGKIIAESNDGGDNGDARLIVTPSKSGTYYVQAMANGGSGIGEYRLLVEQGTKTIIVANPYSDADIELLQGADQGTHPVNGTDHISYDFGAVKDKNGVRRSFDVRSVSDGVVVSLREDLKNVVDQSEGYANFVTVRNNNGTYTTYAHLDMGGVIPSLNDTVSQGEIIGKSGQSGYTSTPHLHIQFGSSIRGSGYQYATGLNDETSLIAFSKTAGMFTGGGGGGGGVESGKLVTGSEEEDELTGGAGNDTLTGLSSSDLLDGGGGDDWIDGGAGNDNLTGGLGADTIIGGPADNSATSDDDVIQSGDGNDLVYGYNGADWIFSGADDDTVYAGIGNDTVLGGRGDDYVYGGQGDDSILPALDNDTVESGLGNDTILAGQGNDLILAGKGNDVLMGGLGDDTLHGAMGDDIIEGNAGSDSLVGGAGADEFVFSGAFGADTIADFKAAEGDSLRLEAGATYSVASTASGARIDVVNGGSILLMGVSSAEVTAAIFT